MDLLDELNRMQHVSAVTCCETTDKFSGTSRHRAVECDRTGVNKHSDGGSFPFLHHRGPFAGFISVSADFLTLLSRLSGRISIHVVVGLCPRTGCDLDREEASYWTETKDALLWVTLTDQQHRGLSA